MIRATYVKNYFVRLERTIKYPSNVLVAKRLMIDFVPTTGAVRHKREERDPLDVAFVETTSKWRHTGYYYGEKHAGVYTKCHLVTKEVQERTFEVVKAGHFWWKQDNDSTISTKGTASTGRRSTTKK